MTMTTIDAAAATAAATTISGSLERLPESGNECGTCEAEAEPLDAVLMVAGALPSGAQEATEAVEATELRPDEGAVRTGTAGAGLPVSEERDEVDAQGEQEVVRHGRAWEVEAEEEEAMYTAGPDTGPAEDGDREKNEEREVMRALMVSAGGLAPEPAVGLETATVLFAR